MIAASYVFYAWWDWRFIFLLLASTLIAHFGATAIDRSAGRTRTAALWATLACLLGLLGWFKYYGFFALNLDNALHSAGLGRPMPLLAVTLPVGISFFTFMAISYVVDVYRRVLRLARAGGPRPSTSRSSPTWWPGPSCGGPSCCPRSGGAGDGEHIEHARAFWLISAGLFKKVVLVVLPLDLRRRPRVRRPPPALGPRDASWPPGATPSRSTPTSAATPTSPSASRCCSGIRFPKNFDAAVHGVSPAGLLAPLAHHPVVLAARLPLHPARRQPRPRVAGARSTSSSPCCSGAVARGGVELHRSGALYHGVGQVLGAPAHGQAGRGQPAVPVGWERTAWARFATFQLVCGGLALLPGRLHQRGRSP